MSKSFEVTLKLTPAEVIARAREAAQQNGLILNGDEQTGHFAGRGVEGVYAITGDKLAITVLKKPVILPWALLESQVRTFFS
jgi:hypothetical protein